MIHALANISIDEKDDEQSSAGESAGADASITSVEAYESPFRTSRSRERRTTAGKTLAGQRIIGIKNDNKKNSSDNNPDNKNNNNNNNNNNTYHDG